MGVPVRPSLTTRASLSRRRALGLIGVGVLAAACDVREYARRHGAKLRLSVATGPTGSAYHVYGGAVAKVISAHVPGVEATAEVTGASVDNLNFLRDSRSDLALTLATTLNDALSGTGAFARRGRVPARALAVLYDQPTHLVTIEGNGIERVTDLRGRVVSVGGPGSGTEDIADRILRAAGVDPRAGIRRQGLGVGAAADALRDGNLDAFFWSSGVPNGVLTDLASTPGLSVRFLPNDEVLPELQRSFGPALCFRSLIPAATYPHQAGEVSTVGTNTVLVADAALSDALAYEITRVLFAHRDELVAVHPQARTLAVARAVQGSPAPFHPGALRFYREQGAVPATA